MKAFAFVAASGVLLLIVLAWRWLCCVLFYWGCLMIEWLIVLMGIATILIVAISSK